jgi:hypothetical protein
MVADVVACTATHARSEMPEEILFLVEESADGGYEAQAPGYSIYTQGDTLDEVGRMAVDAVRRHFDKDDLPRLIHLHVVREEVIAV